ncbi:sensor domain-containing diguanylate cyclase [Marinimicrobium sp. ABcell2]|uniref:sensor domain-containing diguanylate cyclase n=1 Tax=Marinimicrobium sp. ABcell2 TaxID=3069751 RepID=UPI0027B27046|nr:sensor domain-containing diguanylate cyclase [Marinimicrobium sp. ABcell2]MDQ2077718.1 sensor domain-containing diguanylate cyclase [Marinimicrobium sp. ABcell2]
MSHSEPGPLSPGEELARDLVSGEFEERRLSALNAYKILDTLPESAFDELVQVAAYVCDVPMAVINFIDRDRQWFKSELGLGAQDAHLELSMCSHAIKQRNLFVIPDTLQDPRFADNPLVTGPPYLRFYAGALLETAQGYPLGTLCVLDDKPRELNERQTELLPALARQVMGQLELLWANARQEEMLSELEQTRRRLAALASTDELTGLTNRRVFNQHLDQALALGRRGAPVASLLMADLDHFKRINDSLGHHVGDEVLRTFARICRDVFRTTDVVGRWGGEEFVALLPDTSVNQAYSVAERLHKRLAQVPVHCGEARVEVSVSVGIVALDPDASADANFQRLDAAMYEAKAQGRNCTVAKSP